MQLKNSFLENILVLFKAKQAERYLCLNLGEKFSNIFRNRIYVAAIKKCWALLSAKSSSTYFAKLFPFPSDFRTQFPPILEYFAKVKLFSFWTLQRFFRRPIYAIVKSLHKSVYPKGFPVNERNSYRVGKYTFEVQTKPDVWRMTLMAQQTAYAQQQSPALS